MEYSKLIPLLNTLGSSKLEKIYINIPKEVISMDIKPENDLGSKYSVIFEEVNSFYFVNEDGKIVNKPPLDSSHLNSIGYYQNGVGEFVCIDSESDEITDEDVSFPNFAIEMINSAMFIEARSIKINDKKYKVGYPKI